jgi:hypothetical protein
MKNTGNLAKRLGQTDRGLPALLWGQDAIAPLSLTLNDLTF